MISPINVKVNKYELVVKWCIVLVVVMGEAAALTGPNVCLEKQKYNITKRVKYRAPMSVRTYEWCLAMPPRCSRWHTEMRNLTRLETEERTADVEVCCPGYKIKDISCIPICPHGKTGHNCLLDCPPNKWGPNCAHDCKPCLPPSACSPLNGDCVCLDGWQGESCEFRMSTSTTTQRAEILTTSTPPTVIVKNTTHSKKFKNTSFTENITISTSSSTVESTTPTFSTSETGHMPEKTEATTPLTSETTKTDILDTRDSTKPIVTTTSGTTKISTEKESILYRVPILSATTQQPTAKLINSSKVETTTSSPKTSTVFTIVTKPVTETPKDETTRKTEAVSKFPTTLKFKPKEIWIRPATKGESSTETRTRQDTHTRHRNATKIEIISITTPRTILVSIIPSSISYSLHKKITLSSTPYHTPIQLTSQEEPAVTESLSTSASTPSHIKSESTKSSISHSSTLSVRKTSESSKNHTTLFSSTQSATILHVQNSTNSMSSTNGTDYSSSSLTLAPTVLTTKFNDSMVLDKTTEKTILTTAETTILKLVTTETSQIEATTRTNTSNSTVVETNLTQILTNAGNADETNKRTTQSEEIFPILTEPEHITAIATDKAQDRTSVDLISVLSIAGGVMFAVITVAVIIVMIERCRRPRYEDVRKMDNIRMKVLMDEEDLPPPYVRSIFHTPLPEPPVGEKCHYQPISTLDRNLKQFMRPVVVQTISPIMIENFRGILECHYDHLPRRSHAFDSSQCDLRCSLAPSVSSAAEPLCSRATSMIDAIKCEAKLDEIDSTTSEPLYAEIPAWRPPSEHAIEVMNINGEACTEL